LPPDCGRELPAGCARAARRCSSAPPRRPGVEAGDHAIAGVHGRLYRTIGTLWPEAVEDRQVTYGEPAARWVLASKLLRDLGDCTAVPLETLCPA